MKKKKRKNTKLRRSIRRTVASLFMVMAVVVAAIPVENYGTMEAAGSTTVESNYSSFTAETLYKETDYESAYANGGDGEEKTVQRIEDSTFSSVFKVKTNASVDKAMITEYVGTSSRDSFTIGTTEYFDYVQLTTEYVEAVENQLRDEEYKLTFGTTTETIAGGRYTINDVEQDLPNISVTKINTDNRTYTSSSDVTDGTISVGGVESYNYIGEKFDTKEVYETYTSAALTNQLSLASTYNTNADNAIDTLNQIKTKLDAGTATTTDVTSWNNYASRLGDSGSLTTECGNAKTVTKKFSELTDEDSNKNKMADITEQAIINRVKLLSSNTSVNLKDYQVIQAATESGSRIWLLQCNDSDAPFTQQTLDDAQYLVGGKVTIVGIDSNAFSTAPITNLTIPGSVEFIASSAFEGNTTLESVTIEDGSCKIIGDEAFASCSKLKTVTLPGSNSLKTIGSQAFKNSKVSSIVIPGTVQTIGDDCFTGSSLTSVTFTDNSAYTVGIGDYAFYNCYNLATVSFGEETDYTIGTGAFALGGAGNESMTTFQFPKKKTTFDSTDEDYILAGRADLETVTMPDNLTGSIPDNTFLDCLYLGKVIFPEGADKASYTSDELFSTVQNTDFYVQGPATQGNTSKKATPRECTWDAVSGHGGSIPYQFTDSEGTHLELGYDVDGDKKSDYIATIDVIDGTYTATLSKYEERNSGSTDRIAVTIPAKVGDYTIVAIGDNCFGDDVIDKIYKLTIEDGTIETISENAFRGADALQWVYIGNSVKSIGSGAFADCPELENVVFSQTRTSEYSDDDSYWTELTVADDAFATGSQRLTFHGAINPDYAPYVIAMSEDNSDLLGTDCQILYKTDAPLGLTVIRDRSTGEATLIDYPHYDEIDTMNSDLIAEKAGSSGIDDYSIVDKFETINGIQSDAKYADAQLDTDEKEIVEQTLTMTLPKGIDSIDSAAYFNSNANYNDITAYFTRSYADDEDNKQITDKTLNRNINKKASTEYPDVAKLYSDDSYVPDSTSHAGLFSGYFNESELASASVEAGQTSNDLIWNTYNGHDYTENTEEGYDYLTSINLKSVKELPDYAFEDCENLLSVSVSSALEEVGELPFKGCKSLYDIKTNGNTDYAYENMIFYETGDSGSKIIECLEGRGEGGDYLNGVIDADSNPMLSDVTEIADGAFSDCESLKSVDLSTTSVKKIPEDAFEGCSSLTKVVLPSTTTSVGNGALSGLGDYVELTVPNSLCVISEDVIDDGDAATADDTTVVIKGVKYINETTGETSPCYQSYEALDLTYPDQFTFSEIGSTYTVEFVNGMDNMSTIKTVKVDRGESTEAPTAPAITGYKFSEWVCKVGSTIYTGADTYTNVTEDRTIIATYVADPSSVASDGNTYTLTISGGTGFAIGSSTLTPASTLTLEGGTTVTLIYTDVSGTAFKAWTAEDSDGVDYSSLLGSQTSSVTTFTMPNHDVTVTATNTSGTTSDTGSGTNSGTNTGGSSANTTTETQYTVTVNYGSGSGQYEAGDTVSINAYSPDSSTKVFSKWTTTNTSVGFASATSASTTFVMPKSDVTVTANYKTRTDDDDEDDSDAAARRTSSTTTTTTTTGTGGTTTTTTGTDTTGSGDQLYITKDGISNKDVGSATVEGSTDNFVVKISESDVATAEAEEALRNRFGSLDGIVYVPMDISLYDSTGKTEIEDTTGLNVTVTMPIPDALIQYGGNTRMATADNGNLSDLNVRFTTIDGIACMSFTAPHFSTYVAYVDTNNLVDGRSDVTPKTGDPIHPKWFLAGGMACLSILLFATGDRKRKVKAA